MAGQRQRFDVVGHVGGSAAGAARVDVRGGRRRHDVRTAVRLRFGWTDRDFGFGGGALLGDADLLELECQLTKWVE